FRRQIPPDEGIQRPLPTRLGLSRPPDRSESREDAQDPKERCPASRICKNVPRTNRGVHLQDEADDCPARYIYRLETGIQDNGPIILQTNTTIIHQTLQHRPPIHGLLSHELMPTLPDSNSISRSQAP